MFQSHRINLPIRICTAILLVQISSCSAFLQRRTIVKSQHQSKTELGLRVAYQGVPGAYSEKSTRELLGESVIAVGRPDFESCFRAVASMEVDYACLPVENSLGGSIHENYDLMLRYDLTICAEHDFRVQHCVLVKEGVAFNDIKYAISHPQALAQCDNYLRGLGITPIPTYDTAGSAKMIMEEDLPDNCTPENTCAIASDLAGRTYGLNCLAKGVEDDDTNFTRFLLLGRKGVVEYLTKSTPAKTSVVFTLSNTAGALYKALACFSLREIDCSKIESRPTSASLLNYLKFRSAQNGGSSKSDRASLPRFRYCFYLDFLSGQFDRNTENALAHLREQAEYVRILGSYPRKSRLVGPVAEAVEELKAKPDADPSAISLVSLPSDAENKDPLNIGIIGFGAFGQSLASRMAGEHRVSCMDRIDKSSDARSMGIDYYPHFESSDFFRDLDVVILSVPMIDFEECVYALPADQLAGKLLVDVCPLNMEPRNVMLKAFRDAPDIDILVTNPMFGVYSPNGKGPLSPNAMDDSWDGRPMVYEKVRVSDMQRCDRYLQIFEEARCQVVEMASDQHDASTADAEFVTRLVGRLLDHKLLPPTPVTSKEYSALNDVAEMASSDSFDLFFGMYKYNERAQGYIASLRESLAAIERQLAGREAYFAAKAEMRKSDRQQLLAETRLLFQELAKSKTFSLSASEAENKSVPDIESDATKDLTMDTKG
eukprot:scaffold24801_cov181-Cylindrotheca_fusiformis.AAC.12